MSVMHGILFLGSTRGFTDAVIVAIVTACGVLPAVASVVADLVDAVRHGARGWLRRGIVIGELVTAVALLNASRQLLADSVCVRVVAIEATAAGAPNGCTLL
jgi:hypothetical protein